VDWVIGDIHGMLRPLSALLNAVSGADPDAHFIFVGDYVNRGPDARGVIDLLLTLPRATFLRGNHDDNLDLLLNSDCYICDPTAPDRVSAFNWFMQHGLAETLTSYGVDLAKLDSLANKSNEPALERALAPVPENHRQFLRSLQPIFESTTFFVAHGYWDPDDSDQQPPISTRLAQDPQLRHRLLWGRFTDQQLSRKRKWSRTGYFGHSPVSIYRAAGSDLKPLRFEKLVLIDTASALSSLGMLTAICPQTDAILQANRAGEVVAVPI
jgi:hypothetical protein